MGLIGKFPLKFRQKVPGLPLICDPSHITGDRSKILEVGEKAFDMAMEGLMIEPTPTPDNALSDRKQQVTPNQFGKSSSKCFSAERNLPMINALATG